MSVSVRACVRVDVCVCVCACVCVCVGYECMNVPVSYFVNVLACPPG